MLWLKLGKEKSLASGIFNSRKIALHRKPESSQGNSDLFFRVLRNWVTTFDLFLWAIDLVYHSILPSKPTWCYYSQRSANKIIWEGQVTLFTLNEVSFIIIHLQIRLCKVFGYSFWSSCFTKRQISSLPAFRLLQYSRWESSPWKAKPSINFPRAYIEPRWNPKNLIFTKDLKLVYTTMHGKKYGQTNEKGNKIITLERLSKLPFVQNNRKGGIFSLQCLLG